MHLLRIQMNTTQRRDNMEQNNYKSSFENLLDPSFWIKLIWIKHETCQKVNKKFWREQLNLLLFQPD